MIPPPDLSRLTEAEKDTLILALWAQAQTLTARVAGLEARLSRPPKTPGNSSLPPSKGHKANRPEKTERAGPRQGSLGRAGGCRFHQTERFSGVLVPLFGAGLLEATRRGFEAMNVVLKARAEDQK